jgi:hypothetical protein
MAAPQLRSLIRRIAKLSGGSCAPAGTDRQLLDALAARHDESAFAELVARHGPLVSRVCRRVLGHEQAAEDAFSATFLVPARHTVSIRKRARRWPTGCTTPSILAAGATAVPLPLLGPRSGRNPHHCKLARAKWART